MNTEKLMWRREHFPLTFFENTKSFTKFLGPALPPYHPDLKDGLNPELVLSVLEQGVSDFARDLREICEKIPHHSVLFDAYRLKFNPQTGLVVPNWDVIQERERTVVAPFPNNLGQLCIEPDKISPYGGDHYIKIPVNENRKQSIWVGNTDVEIPDELMREYDLTDGMRWLRGKKRFTCSYLWEHHNLNPFDRTLYKNLIIAIDNETVRRKYSEDV